MLISLAKGFTYVLCVVGVMIAFNWTIHPQLDLWVRVLSGLALIPLFHVADRCIRVRPTAGG